MDFSLRLTNIIYSLGKKKIKNSSLRYLRRSHPYDSHESTLKFILKQYLAHLQPEELLIAILTDKQGLGYILLERLLTQGDKDTDAFLHILQQNMHNKIDNEEDFPTPPFLHLSRSTVILYFAQKEARFMNNTYIGTEHIVLSYLYSCKGSRNNGQIVQFCNDIDFSVEQAREICKHVQEECTSSYNNPDFKKATDSLLEEIFAENTPEQKNTSEAQNISTEDSSEIKSRDKNSNFFDNMPFGNETSSQNDYNQKGEKKSFISKYSTDITKQYRKGKAEPVVGREKEINRLIQILSRRTKNNPVLVGEPGIGKTAIAERLAQKIVQREVPFELMNKRILSLDLSAMVAGTNFRGEFEERMKRMIKEVREDKNIILFIDELHTLIGAGAPAGQMDASNIIKPVLSRGGIQIIGATTTREYTRYIEKDSALARRFQKITVEEPNDEESIKILEGIKSQYEEFHGVTYDDGVIPAIVKLSRRYIPDRFLPDKAIDILDEAGAQKKIQEIKKPQEILEREEHINALIKNKEIVAKNQNFEEAARLRDKIKEEKHNLEVCINTLLENKKTKHQHITSDDIARIVSEMTGIPIEQMSSSETERLINMEKEMHKMVIGQDNAVHLISGAIRRNRAGISSPKRPIGSFVFLGPTGVGKTQLAKTLAKFMFGSEEHIIRIDMSDFMEKHNVARLIGAPPGYIGYEEGGTLTEQVRHHPYSVLLLDEIEKSHPDIFNLLLQILEEGELNDNLGHTINFRNTVIIMTSNAGARQISSEGRVGFSTTTNAILPYSEIKSSAISELKKILSPELINRIDDIVVFNALSKEEVSQILDIQIAELAERLSEKGFKITLKKSAREYLVDHGFDANMGARPMRRLIQKEIEDPLSLEILNQKNKDLKNIVVNTINGNLRVHLKKEKTLTKNSLLTDTPEETPQTKDDLQ